MTKIRFRANPVEEMPLRLKPNHNFISNWPVMSYFLLDFVFIAN
jgi:hypothetical protein